MGAGLDNFLEKNRTSLRLGERQRNLLHKLVDRCNAVICWNGQDVVPDVAAAVMVIDTAPAARVEMMINALHENSIVIVPGSENPAFDTLKFRLHAHGSLGADGIDAPHQIWWGGPKPPAVPTGLYRKQDTLFVSAYDDSETADHAALLSYSLHRLGLEHAVVPAPRSGRHGAAASTVDIIRQHWATACRPVFWIDPRARIIAHPLLPQAIGCDFAVHRRRDGAMANTGFFFHQTEEAGDLLDVWQRLVTVYPDLPDCFLLDQAWTMTCAQRQIATTWLPDLYSQQNEAIWRHDAVIIADSPSDGDAHPLAPYTAALHAGRRFYRPHAPEAHLVVRNPAGRNGLVTVVIGDTLTASAADVRESIDAAARAFATDGAGFSQMEIVLCGWTEDIEAVLRIEDHSSILMTSPSERLQQDAFQMLALDIRNSRRASSQRSASASSEMDKTNLSPATSSFNPQDIKRSHHSRTVFRHRDPAAVPITIN